MEIYARNDNPIVLCQADYEALKSRIKEIEPNLRNITLYATKVKIENIASRTFQYPKCPTTEWVVGRVQYMMQNNL